MVATRTACGGKALSVILLLYLLCTALVVPVCALVEKNVTFNHNDVRISLNNPKDWHTGKDANFTKDNKPFLFTFNASEDAIFDFSGIAFYYLCPKWPTPVSINASIDGHPPVVWNLQDMDPSTNPQPPGPQPRIITPDITDPGPPTSTWGIVGSFVGLDNSTHMVQIWFDERWSSMAVIDSYMITTVGDVDPTATTQSSSTSITTSMFPMDILSPQGSQYLEKLQLIYPEYERLRESTIAVSVLFAFSFVWISFVTWVRMVERRDRLDSTTRKGDDEEGDPNPATYLDGVAEKNTD